RIVEAIAHPITRPRRTKRRPPGSETSHPSFRGKASISRLQVRHEACTRRRPDMGARPTMPRSIDTLAALMVIFCGSLGCIAAPAGGGGADLGRRADGVEAETYTLYIHGRNASSSTTPGDYGDFSYWGSEGDAAGPNPRAVNWDGRSR